MGWFRSSATPAAAPDPREAERQALEAESDARGQERQAYVEEAQAALRRRGDARASLWTEPLPPDAVGLALSGGGIRSATFSLGLLRALGDLGLLARVDYLSTVSGGGYAGAFCCSLHVPMRLRGVEAGDLPSPETRRDDDPLASKQGLRGLDHLRQSGRYLLPNGLVDGVRLGVIGFRNWLTIHFVVGLTLVTIYSLLKSLQAMLVRWPWLQRLDAPEWLDPVRWMRGAVATTIRIAGWEASVLFSPLFLAVPPLLAVGFSCGWAYWFARRNKIARSRLLRLLGPTGVGAIAGLLAALTVLSPDSGIPLLAGPARRIAAAFTAGWSDGRMVAAVVAALALVAVGAYLLAETLDWRAVRRAAAERRVETSVMLREAEEDRVRSRLTGWTTRMVEWALIVSGLAIIDTAGQTLYAGRMTLPSLGGLTVATALLQALRWLLPQVKVLKLADILRRFGRWLALAAGLLLALILASGWAVVAHVIAWRGGPIGCLDAYYLTLPPEPCVAGPADFWPALHSMLIVTGFSFFLSCCAAFSYSFLNLSSFASFYGSRLRRAYLGASNAGRDEARVPIDREHEGDEIALDAYYHRDVRAPVHLINITINETRSRASKLIQRDRRGKPFVVAPAGFLHAGASMRDPMQLIRRGRQGEADGTQLPLSSWIGISGAAFSTGLGHQTSLGLSLLAGLANLRLGYWWTPRPRPHAWFPARSADDLMQLYLWREHVAAFRGTDGERWYLTDGGHFENTGAYELIRRRVPLIILADNGSDVDYQFSDLVNLIRKVRIDFDADVHFLRADELDAELGEKSSSRRSFGELRELNRDAGGPYAALARVRYKDESPLGIRTRESTLLLLKPRLQGTEPPDLLSYRTRDARFPQQPTSDQFFDEAQWESYFRLGVHIAETVFDQSRHEDAPDGLHWRPWALQPLPASAGGSRSADPPPEPPAHPQSRRFWRILRPHPGSWMVRCFLRFIGAWTGRERGSAPVPGITRARDHPRQGPPAPGTARPRNYPRPSRVDRTMNRKERG